MGHQTPNSKHPIRRRWPAAVLVATLIAAACSAGAPADAGTRIVVDTDIASRIDRTADEAFSQLQLAGMSVAVARSGELVFASGYGFADLTDQVPAGADTIYRLGSIGKSFTAATLLRLAEEGRVSLDDPITKHLSGYPAGYEAITVRQLLAHTAGIPDHAIAPILETTHGVGYTRDELFGLIAGQAPWFQPGTQWSYSNGGYMMAGDVIESVTGDPYVDVVQSKVLEPLGLADTSVCPNEAPDDDRWAAGYGISSGTWTRAVRLGRPAGMTDAAPINMDVIYSAGSLCASVVDLVRWPQLLEEQLLSPESFEAMTTPTVLSDGTPVGYGLGLQVRTFGDHRALSHGGIISGFVTMLATFPDDGLTVALLVNTDLAEPDTHELLRRILGAVFDEDATWSDPYPLEPSNV